VFSATGAAHNQTSFFYFARRLSQAALPNRQLVDSLTR